jgi:hypothetical protein
MPRNFIPWWSGWGFSKGSGIMKLTKELVGLSAEYAVACALCRRNIYAQLTLGNRKRTDILIETDKGMARIQVKGKTGPDWPRCKGIFRKNDFLVFVDFKNKSVDERSDFYILNVDDWIKLLEKEIRSTSNFDEGYVTIDEENVPIWKGGNGSLIEGHNITPKMIVEHEGGWDKIKKRVGETE